MARPLSDERRNAILAAAASLVAEQGLGASTAEIARRAGVANGSPFTYFETKADLLNALYLALKGELTETVLSAIAGGNDNRSRLQHMWSAWIRWGVDHPAKSRALAQLSVSDEIPPHLRAAVYAAAAPVIELIAEVAGAGALRTAPPSYVTALVETMAGTTMDCMMVAPTEATLIASTGFDALWAMLT